MSSLRFCRACSGPRPRAAMRCPWCLKDYTASAIALPPEHLFGTFQGEDHRAGRRQAAARAITPGE